MIVDFPAIVDAVLSRALATGHVKRHDVQDLTAAPGAGVTCTVVLRRFAPVRRRSGLAATSLRLDLDVQLYVPMPDQRGAPADPQLWAAASALLAAYSADFDLGARAAAVDLLGMAGTPLAGELGYTRLGDERLYRVLTITVPVLVDDVFDQEA